jgi:MFS family permease
LSPLRALLSDYREAAGQFSRPARALLLTTFLSWTAHGMVQVIYNLYLRQAGYQEAFVGRVVSMMGLGMALAALPAGALAHRWGRRRVMVLGAALDGVAGVVRALTLDPAWIVGSTLMYGVASSMIVIPTAPYLTEHSAGRERTHLFSFYFAATLMAGVAGNLLGGQFPWLLERWAVSPAQAYRVTLVLAGVLAGAAALPLLGLRGLSEVAHAPRLSHEERAARRHLLPIGLNAFLIGAGAGLVIPFFNLYFANRFACSSAQIGWFFSVAQMTTALAALLGPAVSRRFGKLRTAVAAELLSLPFLVTLGAEKHLGVAVVAFWLRATLMQASSPLQNAFVMEALPAALRARASSITNTVWNVGWAASASASGWMMQHLGYDVPYYITAALYATAAVTFYWSFRRLPETASPVRLSEEAQRGRGESMPAE